MLGGCGAKTAMLSPIANEPAQMLADETGFSADLKALPLPKEKIVVGVYRFQDQTGQYKDVAASTGGSSISYSKALTQGALSVLVKALEDSGWFTVVEREGLDNLLKERELIRSTRAQFSAEGGEKLSPIPPLLYAGILIEGGVIGYDSNTFTIGAGYNYFGLGGSAEMRKDVVTVYVRAIAVKTGEILKTVTSSKTIISRKLQGGCFKYVKLKRLLEAEAGLTTNEPVQLAVTEALQCAVYQLTMEGIISQFWFLKNPEDIKAKSFVEYMKETRQ